MLVSFENSFILYGYLYVVLISWGMFVWNTYKRHLLLTLLLGKKQRL